MRLPATLLVDAEGRIQGWDRAAADWVAESGALVTDFVGRPLGDLIPALRGGDWLQPALSADAAGAARVFTSTGGDAASPSSVSVRFQALSTATGPVIAARFELAGADRDLPRDAVTDLLDRRALAARTEAFRLESGGLATGAAILFLDLDGFKALNDRWGHPAGDQALAVLAGRWQRCLRDSDLVVRYGGDEFVVLLPSVGSGKTIERVVARLMQVTTEPIPLDSAPAHLSVTIGVAVADGVMTLDELIAAADRDMYARKRSSPHADAH